MNGSSENQKEATDRKMEVLSAKTKSRIGFWNVRTMYETGKLAQVTAEMRQYMLHILGVSESWWTGSGRQTMTTGETVLYLGHKDNQHYKGVAMILRKGMGVLRARLRGRHTNITLIQCYAPTYDRGDTDKDVFYQQLQAEVDTVPRHDLIIVMRDRNAKVGSDNICCDKAMGKHACGTRNENGERLIDCCNMDNPAIKGTLFPHQDIHKLTWCLPSGRDKNQTDHLMINGTLKRSLLDVRVKIS